jgi:hypothetical protein
MDVLDGLGLCFQAAWEMAADFGGIAIRPGAFHERATSMRVAGVGESALPAPLGTGILRGDEPNAWWWQKWVDPLGAAHAVFRGPSRTAPLSD